MIDLSIKAVMVAGVGAVAVAGVIGFARHERSIGRSEVQALWDADRIERERIVIGVAADVAATDQQQESLKQKVIANAKTKTVIISSDHDRAVSAVDGLRYSLDRVREDALSGTSDRARLAGEASRLSESLGECGDRLGQVALVADTLSVQVTGLLDLLQVPEQAGD